MRFVYLFELFDPKSNTLVDTDIFYTVSAAIDEVSPNLRELSDLTWKISFDEEGVLEGIAWFSGESLAATISTYHLNRGEQQEHHPAIQSANSPDALQIAIDDLIKKNHEKQ
jgi:hypothetical protein